MLKSLSLLILAAGLLLPCQSVSAAHKRPVMEEATGAWCGWCTRGWLAMRELKKRQPDFIGVAYHVSDGMQTLTEFPIPTGSYPTANLDRVLLGIDPFYGTSESKELGIEADYLKLKETPTYGDVDLVTEWFDEEQDMLTATVTVTFDQKPEGQCKIGYLLLQNNFQWPENSDFHQANYYSNRQASGLLEELAKMPSVIKDFVFDDIVVEGSNAEGVKNSLPAQVELNKPYTHKNIFYTDEINNIKGLSLLNPSGNETLEVVALLIGPKGEILNARKAMAGTSQVGIESTLEDAETVTEYYDLSGRKVANPAHGIYIKKQGSQASKICL